MTEGGRNIRSALGNASMRICLRILAGVISRGRCAALAPPVALLGAARA